MDEDEIGDGGDIVEVDQWHAQSIDGAVTGNGDDHRIAWGQQFLFVIVTKDFQLYVTFALKTFNQ